MKKFKLLAIPLITASALLSACASAPVNQGPELRGVTDISCLVNTSVDLLDGVSALDSEDGDITPNLQITVTPEVEVKDGYAVFTEAGEYEVCYEIRDRFGKLARTTAYATVSEREVYKANVLTNGFELTVGGGVKVLSDGLTGNRYAFAVSGNEIEEDVKLSRKFTLSGGAEYEFRYNYEISASGKITIAADGEAFAERYVTAGENVTEFTYTLLSEDTQTVNIELWLGGLEGDVNFSLASAEKINPDEPSYANLTEKFFFNNDNLINRDGKAEGVYASEDGNSATLEVTEPTGQMWQVGMFVNSGIDLSVGGEYVVSFDVVCEEANPHEIFINNTQFDETNAIKYFKSEKSYSVHRVITAEETKVFNGRLWLSVRSGEHANKITISNFTVKAKNEVFGINDFKTNSGRVETLNGKACYTVESFGNDWGNTELETPSFALSGAAGNFVVTFKAKASENIGAVFAATSAEKWNTFVWKRLDFTTDEKIYSIRCDDKGVEGIYKFVWQFGSADNAVYKNVTIEISEIKICYLSDLEG